MPEATKMRRWWLSEVSDRADPEDLLVGHLSVFSSHHLNFINEFLGNWTSTEKKN